MKKTFKGKVYDTDEMTVVKKVTYGTFGDPTGYEETLYVAENGTYFLGAFKSDLDQIEIALKNRNSKEGFKGAYIRADAHTPHKYVNDLLKRCADAGVYNILFGTLKE